MKATGAEPVFTAEEWDHIGKALQTLTARQAMPASRDETYEVDGGVVTFRDRVTGAMTMQMPVEDFLEMRGWVGA